MKSFLILGAVALVYAQADSTGYFPGEPSCALPCLSSAITEAGCQLSDIACQCGPTQAAIAGRVGGCLLSSCTDPTDLGAAVNAGQAVCSSFLAGELSFTTPEGPSQTQPPIISSSSLDTIDISTLITSLPTPSATGSSSSGSGSDSGATTGSESASPTPGTTHTDTLIDPSLTILTTQPSSTPTGAAATPGGLGAGVLAGIMAAVALL
ncbi:hypothetical protein GGS24DRAFT_65878 [Hypoxylon argillaceum]|nr:hypothetical protein GGS24DRAFT_65878 [Hypoxylon argillaceum]